MRHHAHRIHLYAVAAATTFLIGLAVLPLRGDTSV